MSSSNIRNKEFLMHNISNNTSTSNDALTYLSSTFNESLEIKKSFFSENEKAILGASCLMGETLNQGGKVLIFGNGGSASDAQHMAAEMIGRMLLERRPLSAIALTTDTSILTAVGNDYSFDDIFLKQVQGLARAGDLLIALSTSGNSKNVLRAVNEGKKIGCKVISLTGGTGGELKPLSDVNINARLGKNASRIQESHIFAIHSLVDLCDRFYLKELVK